MELDRKEILRYLGYRTGNVPDERVLRLIDETVEELNGALEQKFVFRVFPVKETGDTYVDLGFARIESRNLAKNMKGCREVVFLAATLGSRVERLLRRYNRMEMSRAVVLQAAATEAIEKYCDACEGEIQKDLSRESYMRPRFSPGYGDFPLEFQREMLGVLDASKQIGVTLTDSFLMMPSKSVTAVIGISGEKTECIRQGCEACEKTDCLYRRE